MTKVNGKVVSIEDVPTKYLELAKQSPYEAIAKIEADKRAAKIAKHMAESDEDLMEEIDRHFGITRRK
jgi:hypothetical protein